jgi:hypothetical protein
MPLQDSQPDSEVRWQAWLAKGRAHDLRARETVKLLALGLFVAATLSMAGFLALR